MTRVLVAAIATAWLGACVAAPAPAASPVPAVTLGSTCTHVNAVGVDVPHPAVAPPYEAQRLVYAIAELANGGLKREQFAAALRRLADAVAIVAPTQAADVDQVRRSADELARASGDGGRSSIRLALAAALHALAASQPFYLYDLDRFQHAVTTFSTALETVEATAPLPTQEEHEVAALEQAARAIYIGIGAIPPFGAETTAGLP